jgi:NhaP-type Na+/H+ or K+/H+ antiporter
MDQSAGVAVVAGLVVAYALVSRRLEGTPVTAPMVFVAAGVLLSDAVTDMIDIGPASEPLEVLAELTLVIVLFSDAARIDLRTLQRYRRLPVRLLAFGLPGAIVVGTLAGVTVLDLDLWPAALLAAVLAPTDAALGQVVVSDPRVPVRIRQGLNVESGLNDGLAVPFVTLFLALSLEEEAVPGAPYWVRFVVEQIGFGLAVGMVVGVAGAWLVDRASRRDWISPQFRRLAVVALALLAYAASSAVGGGGFVAAFVAGLCFGNLAPHPHREEIYEFAEEEGQLLSLLTFLVFGGIAVGQTVGDVDWGVALYAALSLTVVRMVPVALSIGGLGLHWATKLYVGWFGPRGLASIIFGLLVLEEAGGAPFAREIVLVTTWTVVASVFLHGVTAAPITAWYATHSQRLAAEAPDVAEMEPVAELPLRGRRPTPPEIGDEPHAL